MDGYTRYAIYVAPPSGPLANLAAAWLGWDPETGLEPAPPAIAGLPCPRPELTRNPRKYGFHGTLKPPFRLAEGTSVGDLHAAVQALAGARPPVRLEGLVPARLGRFLALVPEGDTTALGSLARDCVRALDGFRAPPEAEELARRRGGGLTPRQETNLMQWGYPYVMEEFRFHMTLTGPLETETANATLAALSPVVEPLLPRPFHIRELCLFGEGQDGRFRNLHRYPLGG